MEAELESGKAVLQGWLLKRGDDRLLRSRAFKRRWCVLAAGELRYYSKPEFKRHGSQHGKIVLRHCHEVHEQERGNVDNATSKGTSEKSSSEIFAFELVTPTRTWVLAAPDASERLRWVSRIRDMCRLAQLRAAGGESAEAVQLGSGLEDQGDEQNASKAPEYGTLHQVH